MHEGKVKQLFCGIFIVFFCIFFYACGKEERPDYQYEYTAMNFRVEEKDAIFVANLKDAVICRREHANYYFDKDLSPELRDIYVQTSEKVVQFLVEHAGFEGILEVYAADGMYYYNPDSGKCALDAAYAGTSVQAALLVQAATGSATVNYGLLQAEGFSIAKCFGWDISYVPPIPAANNADIASPFTGKRYKWTGGDEYFSDEISAVFERGNQFLLDLEYLCFSPNYVTEEQVEDAWKLARGLSGYISKNGKEAEVLGLLLECDNLTLFEERFITLKNAWLEDMGSAVRVFAREYPIHYGSYGRFALFRMKTLHGDWYVSGDFDTGITKGGRNSWIFRQDYQDVAMRMQELESSMSNADVFLRNKTYAYPELDFMLGRKEIENSAAGCYDLQQKGKVYIKHLHSVPHEYCHYLMLQEGLFVKGEKFNEVYTTQLHLLPAYYGMFSETSYLFFQERCEVIKERSGQDDYFRMLEKRSGGEMLIRDRESLTGLMDFFAAQVGMEASLEKAMMARGDYERQIEGETALYSFAIYMADHYGEDTLYLVSTGNDRVKELTGRTYGEYVEEWAGYLKENFGY